MLRITITKKNAKLLLQGALWVYHDEILKTEGDTSLDICQIYSEKEVYLGTAFYNPLSKIRARLLSVRKDISIDREFIKHRILQAWTYRQSLGYTENTRLVFGEADNLPGLIIDKFGQNFVMQNYCAGVDARKGMIVEILQEIFGEIGVYEKNDMSVRALEGLPLQRGFLIPFQNPFYIQENGIHFQVDVEKGQKTGFFLDQRENRQMIQSIVQDQDVLECFCYTGSFSLFAAKHGAKSVLGLDISDFAIQTAMHNAVQNGMTDICDFRKADTFKELTQWVREGKKYDVVILDPPAFTKSRATLRNAQIGYKEINQRAMRLVREGGYLVTCSCSHIMKPRLFEDMIHEAAHDAHVRLRQVAVLKQAADHPYILNISETIYLKGYILQVLKKD